MAANKTRRRGRASQRDVDAAPRETRAAEVMTVAWAVIVMTLVICELMGIAAIVYLEFNPEAAGARSLVSLLHFCGVVLALVAMAMLPVVYRIRRAPPPAAFVVFAAVVALIPLLTAVWYAVQA